MLSYNHLYDLARRERSQHELQEISPSFFSETHMLFAEHANNLILLANCKRLFRQLYEAREEKIVHLAIARCKTGSTTVDMTKLLAEEQVLFENLCASLLNQRSVVFSEVPTTLKIRVLKSVPQFVDSTMETYGPFTENETVQLPVSIAQVLIRKGTAQQE